MSEYQYSALFAKTDKIRLLRLLPERIRLLRLLPHKDPAAQIKCELFEYSLQGSHMHTHLYEALSYVWGNANDTLEICLHGCTAHVTRNLHAALLQLRNHSIERILWVDALCISQKDDEEKEHQIQLMAEIYARANRVIVWLGEESDHSEIALENIRRAADSKPRKLLSSEGKFLLALLRRPWFRRIWVLQEVGSARQVSILCGMAEIDGYVFCLGLNRLTLWDEVSETKQTPIMIGSITYLIRDAIFRPKNRIGTAGDATLGELMDMYHTYEATVQHDKIYALLGMSYDNPLLVGKLVPNYRHSWAHVFEELVKFVVSDQVQTYAIAEKKEVAVIQSRGFVLGHVFSVEADNERAERLCIDVIYTTPVSSEFEQNWGTRWTVQMSARGVRKGDVICVLKGATRPCIIRMYEDYADIIMICPRHQDNHGDAMLPQIHHEEYYTDRFFRDFLLVWDWSKPLGVPPAKPTFDTIIGKDTVFSQVPSRPQRLHNMGLIARDAINFDMAKTSFREASSSYKQACRTDENDAYTSAIAADFKILITEQARWNKAESLFFEPIHKSITGEHEADSPESHLIDEIAPENVLPFHPESARWPTEPLRTPFKQHQPINEPESPTLSVLEISDDDEDDYYSPFTCFRTRMVARYILLARVNPSLAQEVQSGVRAPEMHNLYIPLSVVEQAAERHGPGMLSLFLDMPHALVPMSLQVLNSANNNAHFSRKLVELLLARRNDDFGVPEKLCKAFINSVENSNCRLVLTYYLSFVLEQIDSGDEDDDGLQEWVSGDRFQDNLVGLMNNLKSEKIVSLGEFIDSLVSE